MFSWISSAWVLPSFVGPTVAAWLTHHLDWRAVFWTVIPLLAVGAAMMLPLVFRLADAPAPERAETSARPAALWAAGLAAVGAAGRAARRPAAEPVRLLIGAASGWSMVGAAPAEPDAAGLLPVRARPAPGDRGARADRGGVLRVRGVRAADARRAAAPVAAAGRVDADRRRARLDGRRLAAVPPKSLPLRRDRIITLGATSVFLGVGIVALVAWWQLLVVAGGGRAGCSPGSVWGSPPPSTSLATMTLSGPAEQGRNASSLQFGEAFGGGLFIGVGGRSSRRCTPATT